LRKNGDNLSNEEYAENLVSYLGKARKTSTISCDDLEKAISKLTGSNVIPPQSKDLFTHNTIESQHASQSNFETGEHVAVF